MKSNKKCNGEGSYYTNPETKLTIFKYTTPDKQRKSIRQRKNESLRDFKKRCNEVIYYNNHGTYIEDTKATFKDLATLIIDGQFKRGTLKQVSYLRKMQTLKIISKSSFFNKKISTIKSLEIQNFIDNLIFTYVQSTINKVLIVLNMVFNEALINETITKNPMLRIKKPKAQKETKKIKAFTIEEQNKFIKALNDSDIQTKTIFSIALYSGLRMGEILALSKNDIDLENNIINVRRTLTKDSKGDPIIGSSTKTYAGTRTVPIVPMLKEIIIEYYNYFVPNFKNLLFTNDCGSLIRVGGMNYKFKTVCSHADIGVSYYIIRRGNKKINHKTSDYNQHMLRHTFATRMIEAGTQAEVLSKILGHTKINITLDTYTDIFDNLKSIKMDNFNSYLKQIQY